MFKSDEIESSDSNVKRLTDWLNCLNLPIVYTPSNLFDYIVMYICSFLQNSLCHVFSFKTGSNQTRIQ